MKSSDMLVWKEERLQATGHASIFNINEVEDHYHEILH